jgi:hypothetical protein
VVFPEVFIPGTPVWVYNQTIWERDDAWYAMLVDQAITVPGPVTDGLGAASRMPASTSSWASTGTARRHYLQHHPLLRS